MKNVESAAQVEFVGREEEQAQMMDAWNMVALSSGQVVVLTGDAGVGKSALTMQVVTQVKSSEAKPLVMLCRAASHKRETPMYTVAQMLKRWSSSGLGERAQVRRILKDAGLEEEAEAHSSPLLSLLGVKNEETTKVKPDDVRATMIALLVALSKFRPIVVVVEDGEHMDAASLRLLDDLVTTKLFDCQMFLLVGVRAKGIEAGSCMVSWVQSEHDNGHHFHVGPFSRDESASMMELLAFNKASSTAVSVPKTVVDFVCKRAEGNPLYTAELFGQVRPLLKLSSDKSSYEVEGDLETLPLPTSLHDAIRARMDALAKADPALGLLMELVAVLGGTCSIVELQPVWEVAAQYLEGDGSALLRKSVANGMKKQVLTSLTSSGYQSANRRRSSTGESSFAFKHLKLFEVLSSAMLKARARELHAVCAETLADIQEAGQHCRHLMLAGNGAEACTLLLGRPTFDLYNVGITQGMMIQCTELLRGDTAEVLLLRLKMVASLLQSRIMGNFFELEDEKYEALQAKLVALAETELSSVAENEVLRANHPEDLIQGLLGYFCLSYNKIAQGKATDEEHVSILRFLRSAMDTARERVPETFAYLRACKMAYTFDNASALWRSPADMAILNGEGECHLKYWMTAYDYDKFHDVAVNVGGMDWGMHDMGAWQVRPLY